MYSFGAQDMVSDLKKVLMKKPEEFMSKVDLNKWNYIAPMNQKIINENYRQFYNIIKKFGTEIIELKINNKRDELCDSVFTHDPSLVVNHGAIILNMGKKLRIKECKEHEILYKSIDIPIIGNIKNNGKVEGGDCLWINKKTLLVGESFRTNKEGINQLSKILNSLDIKLIPIKLPKYKKSNMCFHLMSIVSMLDNDLVIGCKSFIPSELLDIFKKNNINLIYIPEDEYFKSNTLAVNILALSPRVLVLMNGYPRTAELLHNHKCNLNFFDGNELCYKAEGGATCLTRPVLRI